MLEKPRSLGNLQGAVDEILGNKGGDFNFWTEKSYSHGQLLSICLCETGGMKRKNRIDPELEKQIEGMSAKQIRLLASIYAGLADVLRKKNTAESMAKWKDRNKHIWN